jgi:hypothetical protein
MESCKVYKGLDTTCKIKGLFSKYFYIVFVVALASVMFICMSLSALLRGSSLMGFVIETLMSLVGLGALYGYFYKRSNLPKIKKDFRELTISNRELYRIIKKQYG